MTLIREALSPVGDEEGQCGDFSRKFLWKLQGEKGPGLIVQKIQRTFMVHKMIDLLQADIPIINKKLPGPLRNMDWYFRRYMSASEIENFVRPSGSEANATEYCYWEGWYIPDQETVPTYKGLKMGGPANPHYDDAFALCGIASGTQPKDLKNSTRGKYIIYGAATYHPLSNVKNKLPATVCKGFGLDMNSGVKSSGNLPSSTIEPQNLPPATSESHWTVTVRWDSGAPDASGDYGVSRVESHEGPPSFMDLYW